MNIRPFQSGDEKRVIALWQACGLIVTQNDPNQDIQRKLAFQPDLFLVAVRCDQVIGTVMAGYEGHRGWINYLAVDPNYRGEGIGRLLMEYAEAQLKAMGCPKINLQVRAANRRVVDFYKTLGYQVEDVVNMGKRFSI
ncbi:GNAT family acetyltransferase [bacterium]|nr:GNAT family acetyltransferase [bacterium]